MKPPELDSERLTFLRTLDAAEDIEVDNFEAKFIASQFKYQTGAILFSDKQRQVIDRIWCRYGPRLAKSRVQSPESKVRTSTVPAGKCGFLERSAAGPQRCCGQPAVLTLPRGLQLCADHERQRADALRHQREAKNQKLRN